VDIRKLKGILHLKSGLSYVGENSLVLTEELFLHSAFKPYHKIKVLPGEAYAANCVRVNDTILFAEGYPVLAESLRARSYSLIELPVSEFRKMDGGLSCLSLRF
jgi:dimethylargininase